MKVLLWIFGLIAATAIMVYVLRRTKGPDSNHTSIRIPYGPFVIQADAHTGKSLDINHGMVNSTTVSYSVWHNDKPVNFPKSLQTNTGLPFLWRVYALTDVPEPTLIAGSQSLYLVYLENAQPVVAPIHEQGSDFASLQFLDSENGQPGTKYEVFAKGETKDLDKLDTLRGGRYILVNSHVVLDVMTRKFWLFNKNNNDIANYSFPEPGHALALSPDRKKIVFNGTFQSWNSQELPDSEHAIIVYDFEQDSGYPVLYDDTDTRMKNVFDINPEWFNTYFEWNAEGDVLSLRKLETLPYWTGEYSAKDNYYYLYPVKASMLPVFLDFVINQMGWNKDNILSDETGEYTGRVIRLGSGNTKLDIVFQEDEQKISFSKHLYDPDSPEYRTLVEKLAKAFDAELLSGRHQEHFGRIVSEAQRIQSM